MWSHVMQLKLSDGLSAGRTISPFIELGAYEALWDSEKTTFKSIAEMFDKNPGAVPSDFVKRSEAEIFAESAYEKLISTHNDRIGVRVHGAAEYPYKLRDAKYPVELLYYQGWWEYLYTRCVAVVGTRNPSPEGVIRTRKLVEALVEDDFTIVSGLAKGIDTVAHTTAIENKGRTIAVIGTPLTHYYPRENINLQKRIATEYLLISQVPVLRYEKQDYRYNRIFFPERNKTMSALTEATIIVEASETSGTRVQARAALDQGRKLFILDNCFRNKELTWPRKFEDQGAIRVKEYSDIKSALS